MTERMTDKEITLLEQSLFGGEGSTVHKARRLIEALKAERAAFNELKDRVKNGFQGGCWCCESVATKNIELEAKLRAAGELPRFDVEYGGDEIGLYRVPTELGDYVDADELRALLKGDV